VHALRSEKLKAGKDLVTFRSAEGQREPNQPDLVLHTAKEHRTKFSSSGYARSGMVLILT